MVFIYFFFQNSDFLTAVPIHLIKHAFRKIFQLHDELQFMFIPRANFEIFCDKNPRDILWFLCVSNTKFPETVPIHLIKQLFSKMFQIYYGLQLICLPRANFEIFGNNYSKEIPWTTNFGENPCRKVRKRHCNTWAIRMMSIKNIYFSIMLPINLIKFIFRHDFKVLDGSFSSLSRAVSETLGNKVWGNFQ